MSSRRCRIYAVENKILTKAAQNLYNYKTTVSVLLFQCLQMHAKLYDLRSYLNDKQIALNFDFLHWHGRVPVKNSVDAHENVRLSIGMYGPVSEIKCLVWLHAVLCGHYHVAA